MASRAQAPESADRWDRFWRAREKADDFYPATTAFREHVLFHVRPESSVLEVGPGTGRDAAAFAKRARHVTVLDRSGEALALMRRSGLEAGNLALLRGDGLCSPFAPQTFDVVCHQGLLEHFRDPMPLLRDNFRVLRPGGVLIVDVPQTFHPWTVLKHSLIAVDCWFAGWETQYTPGQLRRTVERAGFAVLSGYGDWMRPSLFSRVARQLLVRGRLTQQSTPTPRPQSRRASRWLATSVGMHTACTIGAVGVRP